MTTALAPITVRIARPVPSQNLWNNRRGYQAQIVYRQERTAWMALLRVQIIPRQAVKVPREMRITSYRKILIDYGNLVGGCKMIPDCLIKLGVLWDDKPQWLKCEYLQFKAPEAMRGTVVEILK